MNTDFSARDIIENVNSITGLTALQTIEAVAKMIIAMRPPRALKEWEIYHPYILTHYIMNRYDTPRMCYSIDPYKGRTTDTRISTHLMHILGNYPIEQFLDLTFVEMFLSEYFKGLVKLHNDSIDLHGRSIFGEWARFQDCESNNWIFNKIE